MKTTGLLKYAVAAFALAIGSGCGGGAAMAPSSAALSLGYTTAAHPNLSALPRFPTIFPNRHAKSKTFEYIINEYGSYASIFDYPKSVQQIGEVSNVGGQGCTNVLYGYGKKIVWIVAGQNQIEEIKVPDKVLKTLSVTYYWPSSCAMNASGDLAVGILYGNSSFADGGQLVIFKNGSGSGTVYDTAMDEEFFDGYDNKGNLFADGFTGDRSGYALVELPVGSTKAETITTSNSPEFPGSVQWDGTYLTVFDQDTNEIYQYTVTGTQATLKGTVKLSGSSDCAQTWIVKGLVYCGDAGNDDGEVFKYPAGGAPVATFTGSFVTPLGVTAAKE